MVRCLAALLLLLATQSATRVSQVPQPAQPAVAPRPPDIFYAPTPQTVVDAMLALASVTAADTVYDLGCGDGRIPVTAAKVYGARALGIDIDPERVAEATANAARAGVQDKVKIVSGDLFQTDLSQATVVTLYLAPWLNEKLIPKLRKELASGSRVVSHDFDMGDSWPPEKTLEVDGKRIYLWTIR